MVKINIGDMLHISVRDSWSKLYFRVCATAGKNQNACLKEDALKKM